MTTGFEKAVAWAGSQADLARALGVSRQAVDWYKNHGIPIARAIQIQGLSANKVKAHELINGKVKQILLESVLGARPHDAEEISEIES